MSDFAPLHIAYVLPCQSLPSSGQNPLTTARFYLKTYGGWSLTIATHFYEILSRIISEAVTLWTILDLN